MDRKPLKGRLVLELRIHDQLSIAIMSNGGLGKFSNLGLPPTGSIAVSENTCLGRNVLIACNNDVSIMASGRIMFEIGLDSSASFVGAWVQHRWAPAQALGELEAIVELNGFDYWFVL